MRCHSEPSIFKLLLCGVCVCVWGGGGGGHLMRFQSETYVFKFLLCSVNGALVLRYKVKRIREQSAVW